MAQPLPPKTCSIDRLITKQKDIQRVVDGNKTNVRRNGRYADVGETFELENRLFKISNVYRQTLGEMTDKEAQLEGFSNLEEYKEYILSMHPGMEWNLQMKMWVHEFKPI